LGTKRNLPEGKYEGVAKTFHEHKINGLLLIGGFEAFQTVLQLAENRDKYPEFKIPMVVLPATIR
jgi:6-phosphofructokinase 1